LRLTRSAPVSGRSSGNLAVVTGTEARAEIHEPAASRRTPPAPHGRPPPSRPSLLRRATTVRVLASALTGVLLYLAREPVDVDLLALVGLVPLLWAWRGAGAARGALYGFVAGAVYHGLLVSWTWYFGAVAIVPFVLALAGYWAAAGATLGWLGGRGVRNPLLTAAVWVVADALVGRFPWGGFSWAELGYALSERSWARSLASWGGVTLVTFVIVVWSDVIVDLVLAARAGRRGAVRLAAGAVAGVIAVTAALHFVTVDTTPSGTLRVALLQGNDINRDLTSEEIAARTLPRKHFALAERLEGDYDLVVFPESSLDEDPRTDRFLEERIGDVARTHDTAVLVNAVTDAPDGRAVNLNLLYGEDGELQGTYAKRHLVPFGEYVPFRRYLEPLVPAIEDEIPRDYAPGDSAGLFDVAGHDVATVICFETAFGPLVRDSVRDGAEVVVVSTNNRSYRRSAQSSQHIELSQMRAAETGRPVLHASINGVTAVIDADGRVLRTTPLFVNSVTEARIETRAGQTPYVRYGEWVVLGSLAGIVAAIAVALLRRRGPFVESPPITGERDV
jgi:apolipoprotein N-acyltransferase